MGRFPYSNTFLFVHFSLLTAKAAAALLLCRLHCCLLCCQQGEGSCPALIVHLNCILKKDFGMDGMSPEQHNSDRLMQIKTYQSHPPVEKEYVSHISWTREEIFPKSVTGSYTVMAKRLTRYTFSTLLGWQIKGRGRGHQPFPN